MIREKIAVFNKMHDSFRCIEVRCVHPYYKNKGCPEIKIQPVNAEDVKTLNDVGIRVNLEGSTLTLGWQYDNLVTHPPTEVTFDLIVTNARFYQYTILHNRLAVPVGELASGVRLEELPSNELSPRGFIGRLVISPNYEAGAPPLTEVQVEMTLKPFYLKYLFMNKFDESLRDKDWEEGERWMQMHSSWSLIEEDGQDVLCSNKQVALSYPEKRFIELSVGSKKTIFLPYPDFNKSEQFTVDGDKIIFKVGKLRSKNID